MQEQEGACRKCSAHQASFLDERSVDNGILYCNLTTFTTGQSRLLSVRYNEILDTIRVTH